jgi:hypothetical protein
MRRFWVNASTTVVLAVLLSFCLAAAGNASPVTKTLDENTRMMPPGFIVTTWAEIPVFKKGTVVTLNELGEVLEGILANDVSLPYESGQAQDSLKQTSTTYAPMPMIIMPTYISPQIKRVLQFKEDTKVTFNEKGEVIKGTLYSGSSQNIMLYPATYIAVGTGPVSFYKNGMPVTCTLGSNSYFRPVGWINFPNANNSPTSACAGFIEFKSGKPLALNEYGEVTKGTLNKDTRLPTAGGLSLDVAALKFYEAGTTVEFNEKGIVIKAVHE